MPGHLTWPLRLGRDGSLATAEQDSLAEVESAVFGILVQRKGYRTDKPGVGLTSDPTFEEGGADLDEIRADLAEQETRSVPLLERDPSLLARWIDEVRVTP